MFGRQDIRGLLAETIFAPEEEGSGLKREKEEKEQKEGMSCLCPVYRHTGGVFTSQALEYIQLWDSPLSESTRTEESSNRQNAL